MTNSSGAVVVISLFLVISTSSKITPLKMDYILTSTATPTQLQQTILDPEPTEEESPRLYFDTIKTVLVRTIKSYRAVKPEVKVAMCFMHYAGLTPSERRSGRLTKPNEKDKEVTVKTMIQDIVHMFVMFLSDITPEPVSTMLRMATTMWTMSKKMYKSVKQDEMGNCSIDYMSKRFWWWLGI